MVKIDKDPCENCGSVEAVWLDDLADTPECGCNSLVCRDCGADVAVPEKVGA